MKPIRDSKYRAFIRTLPCIVCGITRGIEAAHTGDHGMGQKASDHRCIPLCNGHHKLRPDSYHRLGRRKFEQLHGVDIEAIIERLNSKPTVKIERGQFVGYLQGERFAIGPVRVGPQHAFKRALLFYREAHQCQT